MAFEQSYNGESRNILGNTTQSVQAAVRTALERLGINSKTTCDSILCK